MRLMLMVFCIITVSNANIILANSDFESPTIGITPPTPHETWGAYIAAYDEADVPGWLTTSTTYPYIEIWKNGNGTTDAYSGNQFAEINAYESTSLYYDIDTTPDSNLSVSVAHRGREGTDEAGIFMGAVGGTLTQVGTMQTDNTAWKLYNITYSIPAGQTQTRIEFRSISTAAASDSIGNFIDNFIISKGNIIAYPNAYNINLSSVTEISGNIITDNPGDYGQPLFIESWTTPSHGTLAGLSNGGDGSFTYTPEPGYTGVVTFDYNVTDGYGSYSVATVTFNITETKANSDYAVTQTDTEATGNVLDNDVGTGLSIISYTQPSIAGASVSIDANGNYTYTPAPGDIGIGDDSFTYTIEDTDGVTSTATVYITVEATIEIDASLVAEYRMDECGFDGTSGDVIDNTTNRLNGTTQPIVDGTTKSTGQICKGSQFDGTDDYIEVTNDTKLNITSNMTVSFWVYPTDDTRDQSLVSKRAALSGWEIWFDNRGGGDRIEFSLRLGGNWRDLRIDKPNNWLGNWHLVTTTFDGSGMALYIKSVENNSSNTNTRSGSISTSSNPMRFGQSYTNNILLSNQNFAGQIDEVKIFSTALIDEQISNIYNNESAGRNWKEDIESRVCNKCECTASQDFNMISFKSDFRQMEALALPRDVDSMLTGDFGANYGEAADWYMYKREYDIVTDLKNNAWYTGLDLTSDLEFGKGYWINNATGTDINYSCNLKTMDFNATVDDYPSCRSANGKCVLVELEEPNGTNNKGPYIYTLTSFPVSKKIRWDNVRILIDGVAYTPDQAAALGETFNSTIWRYDGNGNTYTPVTPGIPGLDKEIDPCYAYWIELDKNAAGKRVQLLIPEE